MTVEVGVLALQGGVQAHFEALRACGVEPRPVRCAAHLEGLTHLVLPGGESTTLHRLMVLFGLWEEVPRRVRGDGLVLFGTCAGAILLGRPSKVAPPRWGLLDVEVERNGYGRQLHSRTVELELAALDRRMACTFIRAPRFRGVGPGVSVLATADGEPVLVESANALAATFHPELSGDPAVHRHFVRKRVDTTVTRRAHTAAP